jgi:adenylate cyclase
VAEANISRQLLLEALARLELQREGLADHEPLAQALLTAATALRARLARTPGPTSADEPQGALTVTALVADLCGYTALSETMDAERVREALNAMWAVLDATLLAWGGTIDQHAGDSVVALFGHPLPRPHDPERAAHAALSLQMELDLFNREAQRLAAEEDGPPWAAGWPDPALRVGLHSGRVYFVEGAPAGPGATGRPTATGEAIRLGRELEEAAPPGGVLLSAELQAQVQPRFVTRPVETEPEASEGRPAGPAFVLLRERAETTQLPAGGPRLIGRETELDRIEVALGQTADSGSLQVVTLAGGAGAGKARLLAEFVARVRLFRGETTILHSRGQRRPWAPAHALLGGLMARRFGIRPQHSRRAAVERVRQALYQGGIRLPEADVALLAAVATMQPGVETEAASATARRLLAALGEQAPVLLVVEALQDVDPASLALIDALVAEPDGLRALLLTSLDTSPEVPWQAPAWTEDTADPFASQARIDLGPLSPVESRLLGTDILSPLAPPPMRLVDLVVAESQGNPLYITELVRHFTETGVVETGSRWSVDMAAAEAVRLPRTLADMLRLRLDHLPETERLTLAQASVMGDVFWDRGLSMLRPLGDGDPDDRLLDEALARLEAKGLIRQEPSAAFGDTLAYRFARPLMRDVAYRSLFGPQRRLAHRQISGWLLEGRQSGRYGEWFDVGGLIAWHAAGGNAENGQ